MTWILSEHQPHRTFTFWGWGINQRQTATVALWQNENLCSGKSVPVLMYINIEPWWELWAVFVLLGSLPGLFFPWPTASLWSKNTENKEAPFGIIQLSPFSFFRRAYPADTKLFNKHTPAWCYRGKNWLSPHRDDTRTTEAKGEEIYIYYWLYFLCVGNSTMKTPNVHLTPSLGVILLKFRGFQLVKL